MLLFYCIHNANMYCLLFIQDRQKQEMFYLTTHSNNLFTVIWKKGKEMFYLMTHSTHFIYVLHGVMHMAKDHSDSERGNPLPPHRLLFPISSKGSFICIIPQTG